MFRLDGIVHQTININKNSATPASSINNHIRILAFMLIRRSSLLVLVFAVAISGCAPLEPPGNREEGAPETPRQESPETRAPVSPPAPAVPNEEQPERAFEPTTFSALPGWDKDAVREAWPAFLLSCQVLRKRAGWAEPCAIALDVDATSEKAIRLFFESFFLPYQVFNTDGSDVGLVTGYYEPLLRGARKRGGPYQTPLYGVPNDLLVIDLAPFDPALKDRRFRGRLAGNKVVPYWSRSEIAKSSAFDGKELLWVDDPIDAFFLQIQGSGRVELVDTKETVRLAFAEHNGHPYRSIGRYLVDQGELTIDHASAQRIKDWYRANPKRQQELLNANPRYVFFREEKLVAPIRGPKGALGVPLTPQRSIAVDPQFISLGVPVFLATSQPGAKTPLQRLVMAQDTGSAILNAVRADYFWGFGASAGEKAGRMKQSGKMWVLLPKTDAVNPPKSRAELD